MTSSHGPAPHDASAAEVARPPRRSETTGVSTKGSGMNRRQLLVSSGAFAATFAIGRHIARAATNPFTLGVASGDPSPEGFVLWTRLASNPLAPDGFGGMSEPVPVLWEVSSDDTMRTIVRS